MSRRGGRGIAATGAIAVAFVSCFLLLEALPGDPLDRLEAPGIPAEQAGRTRRALGLDRPLLQRMAATAASYTRLDLGVSLSRRRPVAEVLTEALPWTLLLGSAGLLVAHAGGLAAALASSVLGAPGRRACARAFLVGAIVPRFWLGVLLVLAFHSLAGWLPASHALPPGGGSPLDALRHLLLPALALGLPGAAVVARHQSLALAREAAEPHVRAARARGLARLRLVAGHVLRPSLGTAVSLLALDLPVLVSGAVVVEVLFAWPGLGRVAHEAVLAGDYPLALAITTLTATVVVAARLATETLARRLDPRLAALAREPG